MRLLEEAVGGKCAGKSCCLLEEGAAAVRVHAQKYRRDVARGTTGKLSVAEIARGDLKPSLTG